jgi:hypothetical protein
VARAQVVIVGVPHTAYRSLSVPASVDIVDLWGILGKATPIPAAAVAAAS